MNCPSCGAPMRLHEDAEFLSCDYCNSIYVPDPDPDGVRVLEVQAAESCPICRQPLVHAAIVGNRIRYCTKCHGMLIVMDLLLVIIQDLRARLETKYAAPHTPDPRDLDRRIHCPQCSAIMDTHPYMGPGNVIVDSCEHCGVVWLDYGELNRMIRAPEGHYEADAE